MTLVKVGDMIGNARIKVLFFNKGNISCFRYGLGSSNFNGVTRNQCSHGLARHYDIKE